MRAVIQRVSRAAVRVDGDTVGEIGRGLLVPVGISSTDTPDAAAYLAEKVATLRIFADAAGKMNLSVDEAGGAVLAVSAVHPVRRRAQGPPPQLRCRRAAGGR